jgi:hypothetical protein
MVPILLMLAVSVSSVLASVCNNASSLLFCEDFQSLPLGPASSPKWGVDTNNGTLDIELCGPGGTQLLHVHTEENGNAFLVANVSSPGNSFFGRMTVKVAAFPTAPNFAHYVLVEASGQGAEVVRPIGGQYIQTGNETSGTALWGVGSDGGVTGDWTAWNESSPSVANQLLCMEWQFDATDNTVNVWINGQQQNDLTVSTTKHGGTNVDFVFPTFETVKFGWELFQSNTTPSAFDLLVNDVALGTTRIGCAS